MRCHGDCLSLEEVTNNQPLELYVCKEELVLVHALSKTRYPIPERHLTAVLERMVTNRNTGFYLGHSSDPDHHLVIDPENPIDWVPIYYLYHPTPWNYPDNNTWSVPILASEWRPLADPKLP
jgi:hypothetical protein